MGAMPLQRRCPVRRRHALTRSPQPCHRVHTQRHTPPSPRTRPALYEPFRPQSATPWQPRSCIRETPPTRNLPITTRTQARSRTHRFHRNFCRLSLRPRFPFTRRSRSQDRSRDTPFTAAIQLVLCRSNQLRCGATPTALSIRPSLRRVTIRRRFYRRIRRRN